MTNYIPIGQYNCLLGVSIFPAVIKYFRRPGRFDGGMHACPQAATPRHAIIMGMSRRMILLAVIMWSRLVEGGLVNAGTDPTNALVIIARHHRLPTIARPPPQR